MPRSLLALSSLLLALPVLAQQPQPAPFRLTPAQRQTLAAGQARLAAVVPASRADDLADAAVFLHTARMADRLNLYTAAAQVAAVTRGLETGRERAEAIARGERPWVLAPGRTLRGYRSRIDDTVQPYGVVLPAGFDPARTYPLHVVLHGRGPTEVTFLTQMEPAPGSAAARPPVQDFLELHPFGRANNGWRWSGETDVFEALAAFRAQYKVDPNRIVLRGFSMGGHGAWHIGTHYPDLWSAVSPGAGFSDTRRYQRIAPGSLPEYQERSWHIYDAVDYALNTFNTLFVGYGGDKDPQLAATLNMAEAAKAEGLDLRIIIGPNTEHRYHPDSLAEIMRLVTAPTRDPRPREVRFSTWTLRYNRCHWVTVDALAEHYRRATVRARVDGDRVTVSTDGVTGLTLDPVPGARAVVIDGQSLALAGGTLERRAGRWRPAARLSDGGARRLPGLAKRHRLQGPIDDAFTDRFLVVRGTGKPWNPAHQAYADGALARFVSEWETGFRGQVRVKDDGQVADSDWRDANVVLFGDPGSNSVLARLLPGLPIRWTRDALVVGTRSFDKDALPVLVFPNPLNPRRYVVLNSGHTWGQKEIDASNAQLFPRLPDWAIIRPEGARYSVLAADYFDERWQIKPTAAATLRR
jgi:hypothetical protein